MSHRRIPIGKRVFARIADNDPSGWIRRQGQLAYANRVASRAARVGRTWDIPVLDPNGVNRARGADETFFLLGSGASIADLEPAHFACIEQGFSVGVNAWPVHDFVPSAYAFEHVLGSRDKAAAIGSCLLRPEVESSSPQVWLTDHTLTAPNHERVPLPPFLRGNTYYYSKLPFATLQHARLEAAFGDFIALHLRNRLPPGVLTSWAASIERMTSFAVLAGFKNIVLVGVDLNSTEYFWQADPSFLAKRGLSDAHKQSLVAPPARPQGSVHRTNDPSHKLFTVADILEAMASAAMDKLGAKIWVANPASALSAVLDVYCWPTSRRA